MLSEDQKRPFGAAFQYQCFEPNLFTCQCREGHAVGLEYGIYRSVYSLAVECMASSRDYYTRVLYIHFSFRSCLRYVTSAPVSHFATGCSGGPVQLGSMPRAALPPRANQACWFLLQTNKMLVAVICTNIFTAAKTPAAYSSFSNSSCR